MSPFKPGLVMNFRHTIGNFNTVLYIVFTLLSILVFIFLYRSDTFHKHIVWLHERGHDLHLRISAKILNITYIESIIDVDKSEDGLQYNGHTDNRIYGYFEKHKKYSYIRFQALSGSGLVVLIGVVLIVLICAQPLYYLKALIIVPGVIAFIEFISFLRSNDFQHFLHPKHFHYIPRHKECSMD